MSSYCKFDLPICLSMKNKCRLCFLFGVFILFWNLPSRENYRQMCFAGGNKWCELIISLANGVFIWRAGNWILKGAFMLVEININIRRNRLIVSPDVITNIRLVYCRMWMKQHASRLIMIFVPNYFSPPPSNSDI